MQSSRSLLTSRSSRRIRRGIKSTFAEGVMNSSRRGARFIPDLLLAAWLAVVMAGSIEARPLFPAPLFESGSFESLFTGDFNNDGLGDLATQTGILLGRGEGTFDPEIAYPEG